MSTPFFTVRLCYNFVSILYLRRLVAGLSTRRPGFEPRPFHVGCVVGRIAVADFFQDQTYFGFPPSVALLEFAACFGPMWAIITDKHSCQR
jgi:hypothetical protein